MNFAINKDKLKQLKENNKKEKKYTILLVDDELANLEALTRLLEEEYNITKAKDGFEALAILRNDLYSSEISLIISDQRMPGMAGVEF
jgi:response regulator RpfG family c-di-GMP phosphodiesterase